MKTNILKNNLIILIIITTLSLLGMGEAKADEKNLENQIINYVNQERVEKGLKQLKESDVLNEVANLKAQDMLGNDYFAHTSPTGVSPWHWFDEAGYSYRFAGENLGMDFKTALAVHDAWMDSEAHRDNILSNKYEEIGVSVKKGIVGDKETQIAVQVFGNSFKEDEGGANINSSQKSINEEISEKDEVLITQSSFHFWKGEQKNEMIISAEIKGEPEKVLAVINGEEYSLEKLKDNIYVDLITFGDVNLKEENILIKAVDADKKAVFSKIPDKYFTEYLIEKDEQKKENNQVVAMLNSDKNNNELIDKTRTWFNQTGLMLLIVGLLIITILDIWILEKEEERLLELKT